MFKKTKIKGDYYTMTNLQSFQEQINGRIQRLKTDVFYANASNGTDEEKAKVIAKAWKDLDEKVNEIRSEYAAYREATIADAKKWASLGSGVNPSASDNALAQSVSETYSVDLIGSANTSEQNAVLSKLEGVIKEFSPGQKVAFFKEVQKINDALIDKVASRASLQTLVAEVKNFEKPYETRLAEAQALPTVIGEEYDTLKAEYEVE